MPWKRLLSWCHANKMKTKGRKDFEKKRNIRANNWSADKRKSTPFGLRAGDGILPKSKKYKPSKKQKHANNSTTSTI